MAHEVWRHSGLRHGQGCCHVLVESVHCAWRIGDTLPARETEGDNRYGGLVPSPGSHVSTRHSSNKYSPDRLWLWTDAQLPNDQLFQFRHVLLVGGQKCDLCFRTWNMLVVCLIVVSLFSDEHRMDMGCLADGVLTFGSCFSVSCRQSSRPSLSFARR